MVRKLFDFLLIPMIGLALMGTSIFDSYHRNQVQSPEDFEIQRPVSQVIEPTQIPVSTSETITQADRVLPRVGGNAGLVLGASVLVLIIIGGVVLTSRKKAKH
jgi:hypothetical protein